MNGSGEDVKRDLFCEIRDKKNISHSAAKRVTRGGRTVHFPSDHLTAKQKKGMSGQVMTYNIGKPMKWVDFKYMPHDLQKKYLEKLRDEHCANQRGVAQMLGISGNAFSAYCRAHSLQVFPLGGRKGQLEKERWEAFLRGEADTDIEKTETKAAEPEEQPSRPAFSAPEYPTMKCDTDFSMRFSGKFNLYTFMEAVSKHIENGEDVYIALRVTSNQTERQG